MATGFQKCLLGFLVALAGFHGVPDDAFAQEFVTSLPGGIGFATLSGTNMAPYTGHTEGDFAVTPTAGSWYEAHIYGDPIPSIFDGPTNSPGFGVLQITDGAGRFTFGSIHYSSNNGESAYHILGFLGEDVAYEEVGILTASFSPFSFNTLLTANPTIPIDGLLFELTPGAGVTSINLDNIGVATVPEPSAAALLALGLLLAPGIGSFRAKARFGVARASARSGWLR